ncbi:uncharacterized protein P174DRAFT_380288, partial [Aspergillus novofumigatus IBT 16806]
ILKILLADDRLDLSWQDGCGHTPLIYSISKGQKAMTKLLLGHSRLYMDNLDPANQIALWHMVQQGNEDLA